MKKLGLINYEGDCLSAVKENGKYSIVDQYGKTVVCLDKLEFQHFLEGEFSIADSKGKAWNYKTVHADAKPKTQDLVKFLEGLPKFKVGDKAYTPAGYKFPCTIVSVFRTTNGSIQIVGEMDEYGLLHIFNEDQLSHY